MILIELRKPILSELAGQAIADGWTDRPDVLAFLVEHRAIEGAVRLEPLNKRVTYTLEELRIALHNDIDVF